MSAAVTESWVAELAQRHLDAAYNLGCWLLGDEQDAADAVHDAYVRAARSAHTYAGGNARAWWLAIVRNCCLAALNARKRNHPGVRIDAADGEIPIPDADHGGDIEAHIDAAQRSDAIGRCLMELPLEFREAIVLRELEDLSYREIADALGIPIGTVMSRLSRGRKLLQRALRASNEDDAHGL